MDYSIVVTNDAEDDLNRVIQYLLFEKKSKQAKHWDIIELIF